jgi:hypothetical protein
VRNPTWRPPSSLASMSGVSAPPPPFVDAGSGA